MRSRPRALSITSPFHSASPRPAFHFSRLGTPRTQRRTALHPSPGSQLPQGKSLQPVLAREEKKQELDLGGAGAPGPPPRLRIG